VHEIAEQLEHIKSPKLVDRLDAFLKFPSTDPHGDPIPDEALVFRAKRANPLSELDTHQLLQISGVADHSPVFMEYMMQIDLSMGEVICIEEINNYDASMRIKTAKNRTVFISSIAAKNILASPHHVHTKRA
jgi:DtxR family Mn-dependent transcriptional regulator